MSHDHVNTLDINTLEIYILFLFILCININLYPNINLLFLLVTHSNCITESFTVAVHVCCLSFTSASRFTLMSFGSETCVFSDTSRHPAGPKEPLRRKLAASVIHISSGLTADRTTGCCRHQGKDKSYLRSRVRSTSRSRLDCTTFV